METFLGLDYNMWWFLVLGGVISGYAILDGFDLGAGALHLFLKKEESRRKFSWKARVGTLTELASPGLTRCSRLRPRKGGDKS